ncbi:MAG: sigma-54-dependent transcriptional regulator [Myxococcota bacterium]
MNEKNRRYKILIVDDEVNILKVLSASLRKEGYETFTAENGEIALKKLYEEDISVVLTDLKMPEMDGIELLKNVMRFNSDIPVIILTAHGTINNAVEAIKIGAFDYLTKPFDRGELVQIIKKAVNTFEYRRSDVKIDFETDEPVHIIGRSQRMQEIYSLIEKIAPSDSTVLITGESGTGKELVARIIHLKSQRARGPFIKVNCAAIPRELVESELFGYEKGAFTGAFSQKPGRFELADGGTILLDEVSELPFDMQAKLLRVLQEHQIWRIGGIKSVNINVRVISATNRNLAMEVERGNFRSDLYYRINVVPIEVPPLREHREDIKDFVNYFIQKFAKRNRKTISGISDAALEYLINYPWPGNVRELENLIERMVILSSNEILDITDIPEEIKLKQSPKPQIASFTSGIDFKEIVKKATSDIEKDLILKALKETGGNVTRAAELLGISRKSLQLKMKELGLREED